MPDTILKPGEKCPDGYRTYSYLGDMRQRCRAPYRYGLMPLDTPPESRWAHAGHDFPKLTDQAKAQADKVTGEAIREGRGAWGIYDRTRKRFAYEGDYLADLRRRVERQERHVANQQAVLVKLRAELEAAEAGADL